MAEEFVSELILPVEGMFGEAIGETEKELL